MNDNIEKVRNTIDIAFALAILEDNEEEFEKMLFEEIVKISTFEKEYGGNENYD